MSFLVIDKSISPGNPVPAEHREVHVLLLVGECRQGCNYTEALLVNGRMKHCRLQNMVNPGPSLTYHPNS